MSPPPIKYYMLIQKGYKIKIRQQIVKLHLEGKSYKVAIEWAKEEMGEKENKLSYNLPDDVAFINYVFLYIITIKYPISILQNRRFFYYLF